MNEPVTLGVRHLRRETPASTPDSRPDSTRMCRIARHARSLGQRAARSVPLVAMLLATRAGEGKAQAGDSENRVSFAVVGGGSYLLSDLEIVPGVDQNGGWGFDVGLRARRGRASLALGYHRFRFDVGPIGSSTVSGIFAEPRFALGGRAALRPYAFARVGRVVDYDAAFCCSVYEADPNARGWLLGGGFGFETPPIGSLKLDLGAGVHRLSGNSTPGTTGTWKSAGPMVEVRLGGTLPIGTHAP